MKLTVSRSLLSDSLRKVQGLASGRNTMPILSNIKIEAFEQHVTFTSTDIDLTVITEMPCNVTGQGAVTLPAKLLCGAIDRAVEGDVSIDIDDKTCKAVIKSGNSVFRITGLSADEFPKLPEIKENSISFSIPQEVLKSLIRKTAFAISPEETRLALRGVHFEFADGFLTCAATDGRRLAVAEYHPEEAYDVTLKFTLPTKSVGEINKHLGTSGVVKITKNDSQITAALDNGVVMYSKIIDVDYPNYKMVIPKGNTKVVIVDREAFIDSVYRVGLFSEANSMKFEFANNEIKLSSSLDGGAGNDIIPAKYDGDTIEATYNHNFIIDALKSMDDDEVKFEFSTGAEPVIIKDSCPGLSIIMPLRVN